MHDLVKNDPIIIEADPNLLSVDNQPKFIIAEDIQMRAVKKTREKLLADDRVMEANLYKMNLTNFLLEMNKLALKNLP